MLLRIVVAIIAVRVVAHTITARRVGPARMPSAWTQMPLHCREAPHFAATSILHTPSACGKPCGARMRLTSEAELGKCSPGQDPFPSSALLQSALPAASAASSIPFWHSWRTRRTTAIGGRATPPAQTEAALQSAPPLWVVARGHQPPSSRGRSRAGRPLP